MKISLRRSSMFVISHSRTEWCASADREVYQDTAIGVGAVAPANDEAGHATSTAMINSTAASHAWDNALGLTFETDSEEEASTEDVLSSAQFTIVDDANESEAEDSSVPPVSVIFLDIIPPL